jgi:hypothetical protein
MLQGAVKKMNRQIESYNEELQRIDEIQDELNDAKDMYDRVKMENEVLLDQSREEPIILGKYP